MNYMEEPMHLFAAALEVRTKAYAPYSQFQVGAALLGTDGKVYSGCNVENRSYSMAICAERAAMVQAIAAGVRSFQAIAIAGGRTAEAAEQIPCVPCGACLQVLREFCSGTMPILLADGTHTLQEFLPIPFQL